jgi:glycosyltransferase involved in cell wall biosynthesis
VKIALVLSSISRANGGISESVRRLGQTLAGPAGRTVGVFSLQDAFSAQDAPAWAPLQPRCFPVRGPRAWGYAPDLLPALAEFKADVSHVSGLWMYTSQANRQWSRQSGRPCVIAPHGMLDAWALRNSAWKKRLAARVFERAHLEQASCLHALCQAEADSIRAYGLGNPVCVVPNGIDLPGEDARTSPAPWAGRFAADRQVMLFLGRLHPKKGLLQLVDAWANLRPDTWQLVIAGWDQGGHLGVLQDLVNERGVADRVTFCGPLYGADKAAAYAAASAFILPSFSEGLPMTILEAWAHGRPVLMTPACNLPEGFAAGAAQEIGTEPSGMAQTMLTFMQAGEDHRRSMGLRGRDLVARHFSWDRVARDLQDVYGWVTNGGPPSACVQTG